MTKTGVLRLRRRSPRKTSLRTMGGRGVGEEVGAAEVLPVHAQMMISSGLRTSWVSGEGGAIL